VSRHPCQQAWDRDDSLQLGEGGGRACEVEVMRPRGVGDGLLTWKVEEMAPSTDVEGFMKSMLSAAYA